MHGTPQLDDLSNVQRIGDFAMRAADAIAERFGPDAKVGAVCIVADIFADGGDKVLNPIVSLCSDPRVWVMTALLGEAFDVAKRENEKRADAVDDADAEDEDEDD